jgi:uncharacterized protein
MQTVQPTVGVHSPELSRIAQDLQIRKVQVESVVQLLDEGNTVPFITRYRKERTGGLDEEKIRRIQSRVEELRELNERRATILKNIEAQGKLTPDLKQAIEEADSFKRLEDLYLPYKPKKKTLASDAREKGLEPLAQAIWNRDPAVSNLDEVLPGMVNPEKGLNSTEEILTGVGHLLSEMVAETAEVRSRVRSVVWETGQIHAEKTDKVTPEKGGEYKDYFQFRESARLIPPHRILAVNRGEKESFLNVGIKWDTDRAKSAALSALPLEGHPHAELILKSVDDALDRLVYPAMEREVRREQTEAAQEHAVGIFGRNLRSLLLQPPLRGKRILALDPGFRTGCKLVAIDENGTFLEEGVIYPHEPQKRLAEAKETLERFIRNHQTTVFAIGNGTACRETEALVSDLIQELEDRRAGKLPPRPEPTATPPPAPVVEPSAPTPAETPAPIEASAPVDASAPVEASVPVEASAPVVETPVEAPAPVAESPAETPSAETAPAAETPATPPPEAAAPAPAPTRPPRPPRPPKPQLPWIESLPPAPGDLAYVIVNEAGASDYSASQVAREEFPNHDATVRGTVSIGRRLQDPLAELVKIDPQHVGVGLYQHDVKAKHLKLTLEGIVESCVNHVGVDVNTASVPLLRHVSGLNQMVARDLVDYRTQHGAFKNREELQKVNGIGPARFTQAAGFLKIIDGEEPLDNTWIHPESYGIARQILQDLGFAPSDLKDKNKVTELRTKLHGLNVEELAARLNSGAPTVKDIVDALARPGRDPREDLPPPIFKKGILKLEDLQPGMELKGTVLNVVDFGAFVDIGLKDSGLVHISQMANRYIKSPYEIVAVGDVVVCWVLKVETDRKRVSLTMISPNQERNKPAPRPPQGERPPRPERPPGERFRDRPPTGDRPQGERPQGDRPPFRGGPRPAGAPGGGSRGGPRSGGDRPPYRGGPPRGRDQGNPGDAPATPPPPPPPPPPPRKPSKPKPLPKLSTDALTGRKPLNTFGELEAFFRAKDAPPPEEPKAAPPAPTESSEPPATPPTPAPPEASESRNDESRTEN